MGLSLRSRYTQIHPRIYQRHKSGLADEAINDCMSTLRFWCDDPTAQILGESNAISLNLSVNLELPEQYPNPSRPARGERPQAGN
jgi:hypothetical protein